MLGKRIPGTSLEASSSSVNDGVPWNSVLSLSLIHGNGVGRGGAR